MHNNKEDDICLHILISMYIHMSEFICTILISDSVSIHLTQVHQKEGCPHPWPPAVTKPNCVTPRQTVQRVSVPLLDALSLIVSSTPSNSKRSKSPKMPWHRWTAWADRWYKTLDIFFGRCWLQDSDGPMRLQKSIGDKMYSTTSSSELERDKTYCLIY